MVAFYSRHPGWSKKGTLISGWVALGLLTSWILGAPACKRAPDPGTAIVKGEGSAGKRVGADGLKLLPGMKITLSQNFPMQNGTQVRVLPGIHRNLEIDTPPSSEGLTFHWELKWENSTETPSIPTTETYREEGTMTLANLMQAKGMTLPVFWPPGELYLSNSAAIWLSDKGFQELKKEKRSAWSLGILGSSLWGAVPSAGLFEQLVKNFQQGLEKQPEKLLALQEIRLLDKSDPYSLKVNGSVQEVTTLVAGNWLAQIRILDNAQNPLILEVRLFPDSKLGEILFSPLAPVKSLLEYKVESIDLPLGGRLGQSY